MLNEKEIELIEYMDYQVLNNGMDGWIGNRAYEKLNDFIEVLYKRNSELDRKVVSIFVKATAAGLGIYQHKDSVRFPEIKEMVEGYEKNIQECKEQYQQIAREFMESYGLEDHLTKFMKNIKRH